MRFRTVPSKNSLALWDMKKIAAGVGSVVAEPEDLGTANKQLN
jgi:hypothetical protein